MLQSQSKRNQQQLQPPDIDLVPRELIRSATRNYHSGPWESFPPDRNKHALLHRITFLQVVMAMGFYFLQHKTAAVLRTEYRVL